MHQKALTFATQEEALFLKTVAIAKSSTLTGSTHLKPL
jgi:hypothetical protein